MPKADTTIIDPGASPLCLHIGGWEPRPGWKILNIQPGPGVDFVGDCRNLSQFPDASVEQVYASHVYEHLPYNGGVLASALKEAHRVLQPGGIFRISVPDLEICCRLFLAPPATVKDRFEVMRFIFGGQIDAYDFHQVGLTFEFLGRFLQDAGFATIRRVEEFKLFEDSSSRRFHGVLISLNVEAIK